MSKWISIQLGTGCLILAAAACRGQPTLPPTTAKPPTVTVAPTRAVTPTATLTPDRAPSATTHAARPTATSSVRATACPTATPSPTPPPPTVPTPIPPSPQAYSFSAERTDAEGGDGVLLEWEAVGEKAMICPTIDEVTVGCRCLFDLPMVGSHVIYPREIVGSYTGFQLIVESGGVRTVRHVPHSVACPDGLAEWFFQDPPGICARDAPLRSFGAAQRFERGSMIWLEEQDTYYILYDSFLAPSTRHPVSSSLHSLQVVEGPLNLIPGASPDNRVDETPADGLQQPVSGFGLVWRGEVVGIEDVRTQLGWAVEPEYGFDTVFQCEMACHTTWDCYLEGPKDAIFHLYWLMHFGHCWEPVD